MLLETTRTKGSKRNKKREKLTIDSSSMFAVPQGGFRYLRKLHTYIDMCVCVYIAFTAGVTDLVNPSPHSVTLLRSPSGPAGVC